MKLLARWREWRELPEPGVSPAEKEQLIESMAREVVHRRLETPVLLFLESHRPLGFLASQAVVMASPLVLALAPGARVTALGALLDDRAAIARLVDRIEELAEARRAPGPKES